MNFAAGLLLLAGTSLFQNLQENTKAIETQKSYELDIYRKQAYLYLELALLDGTVHKSEFDQLYRAIKTYDDRRSEVKKMFKSLGLSEPADLVSPDLRKAVKTYFSHPIKCRDDADGSVKGFFSRIASREVEVHGDLNYVGIVLLLFCAFALLCMFIVLMNWTAEDSKSVWWFFGSLTVVFVTLTLILIFS